MKQSEMVEFVTKLGLDPAHTKEVRLSPRGWVAHVFVRDDAGLKITWYGRMRTRRVFGWWSDK